MAQIARPGSAEGLEGQTNHRAVRRIFEAAQSSAPVSGFTHNFYRYPARFSPAFARAVVLAFSKPGDTVFDPFMGGGTTLVEASTLGRRAVGTDINPVAVFVARAKTTPLTHTELADIMDWAGDLIPALNVHSRALRAMRRAEKGYPRNISSRSTWPIRKMLEIALERVRDLSSHRQRRFARCVLLRTGQWALDCRRTIPSAERFRQQLRDYLEEMIDGARDYSDALARSGRLSARQSIADPLCLTRSAVGAEADPVLAPIFPPALILTSPPYPGVHALYHRWQVRGRKETPAPFWVVGCRDGNGASYYTFGDRKRPG